MVRTKRPIVIRLVPITKPTVPPPKIRAIYSPNVSRLPGNSVPTQATVPLRIPAFETARRFWPGTTRTALRTRTDRKKQRGIISYDAGDRLPSVVLATDISQKLRIDTSGVGNHDKSRNGGFVRDGNVLGVRSVTTLSDILDVVVSFPSLTCIKEKNVCC
ncbi:hypothetical protein GWI33_017070 [Rhynchophorus ferrugineus]|uniref:Uncharacterized protein n=1 Tax=Rhynchophorus ferrugineus TaxID=354439 RepID=A0A834M9M7_RHYFE|nr:hypothetical protein GWI33_017070 [Rhynchophorus ferrugineus]